MEELEEVEEEDLTDGDDIGVRTRVLAATLEAVDVVETDDGLESSGGKMAMVMVMVMAMMMVVMVVVVVVVTGRRRSRCCASLPLPLPYPSLFPTQLVA